MITISNCPRCNEAVTIPSQVDLDDRVRCPLCSAEYAVREALPPVVVPLDTVGDAPATADTESSTAGLGELGAASAAATADQAAPDQPEAEASGEQDVEEKPSDESAEGDDMFDFLQGDAAATDTAEPPATGETEEKEAGDGTTGLDLSFASDDSAAAVGTGISAGAGVFPAGEVPATTESGTSAADVPGKTPAYRPRRRKQKSAKAEILGIVIGGVVGLSIAYYGLNYFMGEQMDFLPIGLPGVPHTHEHWPYGGGEDAAAADQPGEDAGQRRAPTGEPYPSEPQPENALAASFSKYLDKNYRDLILDGHLQTAEHSATVPVEIEGETHQTAPEGKVVTVAKSLPMGGPALDEGTQLRKQDDWWVVISGGAASAPGDGALAGDGSDAGTAPDGPEAAQGEDQSAESGRRSVTIRAGQRASTGSFGPIDLDVPIEQPKIELLDPEAPTGPDGADESAEDAEDSSAAEDESGDEPPASEEPDESTDASTEPVASTEPESPSETPGAAEAQDGDAPDQVARSDQPADPATPAAEATSQEPETQEPKPRELPADYIGPKDPPSFTAAQLDESIDAAEKALDELEPDAALSAEVFGALSEAARRLTFLDATRFATARVEREEKLAAMLQELIAQPGRFQQLGRLAAEALADENTEGGIVLTGVAGRVASRGKLHGTLVGVPGSDEPVSVIADHPLSIKQADLVVVLGTIVRQPAKTMIGYPGSKPLLVWATLGVPVPGAMVEAK